MLSVQSPSYAGMERLGVPVRTSIGSSTDERSHIGRRICVDPLQSDDVHGLATSSSHHLYHHVKSDVIRCPHHVALPDSERGSDKDLNNRTSFQHTELTRPYIKAPPNKTAHDIPQNRTVLHLMIEPSSSYSLNNPQRSTTPAKSKPNVIKTFFSKIAAKASESTSTPSSTTTTTSTTLANHPTQPLNQIKSYPSSSLSIYRSVSSDISTNQSCQYKSKLYTSVPTSSTQSLASTIEPTSPPESGSHI